MRAALALGLLLITVTAFAGPKKKTTPAQVITFNDEIACSMECDIGVEGAVAAKPLLELLNDRRHLAAVGTFIIAIFDQRDRCIRYTQNMVPSPDRELQCWRAGSGHS